MSRPAILTTWNDRYFDGQLPDVFLDALAELPTDRKDVLEFVDRAFRLMHHGRFRATDVSPLQGKFLGTVLPRMLPGAWSGRIPPATLAGRHVRIDDYVLNNQWRSVEAGLFLDIGCGFPPATSLDTAEALAGWRIVAADPSLPACVVYDSDQNHATFDAEGQVVYYQPAAPTIDGWNALLVDRTVTESRFRSLRDRLLPALGEQAEVEWDGARLVDPVRLYSSKSLSFQATGIGDVDVCDVDIARCFNVLMYFDADFRRNALKWFGNILRDGGLLLVGVDFAHTTACRYTVYQKVNGRLISREFAFSIDNLCPLRGTPWVAMVDDDHETLRLADLSRELRSDAAFLRRLYEVSDALRAEHDLCPRRPDGYYADFDPSIGSAELWARARIISRSLDDELAPAAVDLLLASGQEAWVNEVGHVAVRPPIDD